MNIFARVCRRTGGNKKSVGLQLFDNNKVKWIDVGDVEIFKNRKIPITLDVIKVCCDGITKDEKLINPIFLKIFNVNENLCLINQLNKIIIER